MVSVFPIFDIFFSVWLYFHSIKIKKKEKDSNRHYYGCGREVVYASEWFFLFKAMVDDKKRLKPAPHLRTFPWICASNLYVAQIRGIVRARCVSTSSHKSMELCELDVYPHYASKSYTAKQLPRWKDEYER